MNFTRRNIFALSAGAATASLLGFAPLGAFAAVEDTQKAVDALTGGTAPKTGRITLTAPEIAENGNTVPISISVESPMTDADYVESVTILAEENPNPIVVTFRFSPMSGSAVASTRIRLLKTQKVIAVAKMSDGSVFEDRKEVKVTIGGCGG